MSELYLKNRFQKDGYSSPWSRNKLFLLECGKLFWTFFVRWLPNLFTVGMYTAKVIWL